MNIVENENVAPFDVDDTLVMHGQKCKSTKEFVEVKDPIENRYISLRKNLGMIRLLKEEKARGAYVVVWSKGGYQWALNVLIALNLLDYVDLILTKPRAYYDDKNVSEWLTERVYLGPDVSYKK